MGKAYAGECGVGCVVRGRGRGGCHIGVCTMGIGLFEEGGHVLTRGVSDMRGDTAGGVRRRWICWGHGFPFVG